jgi:hypothetical protein
MALKKIGPVSLIFFSEIPLGTAEVLQGSASQAPVLSDRKLNIGVLHNFETAAHCYFSHKSIEPHRTSQLTNSQL